MRTLLISLVLAVAACSNPEKGTGGVGGGGQLGDGITEGGAGTADLGAGSIDPGGGADQPGVGSADLGVGSSQPGDGSGNLGGGTTQPRDLAAGPRDLGAGPRDLAAPRDLATPPRDLTTPAPAAKAHKFCGWLLATGYQTPDQDPGYTGFAAHADDFDAVHPVWWHVSSLTSFASVYGADAAIVTSHTTRSGQRTQLIPTLAAVDPGDYALVTQMLNDATQRAAHVQAVVDLVVSHGYDGIDLDYEHLPDSARSAFSTFASQLASALHAKSKQLSIAVGGLTRATSVWDYDALSAVCDHLHVMAYDYHYLGSHPGPVAPLGWVQQIVSYIGSIAGGTRKGKFLLGLPNYGISGPDSGATSWFGSAKDSLAAAGAGYATTTTHMASCPFVEGGAIAPGRAPNASTANGHLFFDDLASLEEKVALAQSAGLAGVTYWTIGGEPDQPGPSTFFQMVRSHFPK